MAIEFETENNDNKNINGQTSEAEKWLEKIEEAGAEEKSWRDKAYQCNNVFLNKRVRGRGTTETLFVNADEAGNFGSFTGNTGRRPHSNIFYRNIKTAESVLLPKLPDIVIRPKSAKQDSDSSDRRKEFNVVSDIVLRCTTALVMDEETENEVKKFKHDVLVLGRGILWLMYTPPDENEEDETLEIKRIGINDFRMSPARNWEEVSWIARRILMTKNDLKERYGDDIIDDVETSYPNADDKKFGTLKNTTKMAELWEIWDKETLTVKIVCKGVDEILEEYDDPYGLKNFFPTPEPLLAIENIDSMLPTPELDVYWNEAIALSEMNRRRIDIIKNMKVRAIITSGIFREFKSLLNAGDNAYIPADGQVAQGITSGITLDNMIAYDPLEPRATALKVLGEESDRVEMSIDKITGLGDAVAASNAIMTSGGDAETATKTVMKGKFGNLRLIEKQQKFNDYIKKIYGLAVEIICNVFSLNTLQMLSEIQLRPDGTEPQIDPATGQQIDDGLPDMTWANVMDYMRSKWMSGYILDVETEMNVWEKDGEEYQRRAALVETTLEQLQKYQELFTNVPSAIDFAVDGTVHTMNSQTMTSRMRNAMENALERMRMEATQQAADQAQQQDDDPQMILAKAEQTKAEAQSMEAQNRQQSVQAETQIKAQDVQMKQAETQSQIQKENINMQIKMAELKAKREREMELADIDRQKLEIERMKLDLERQKIGADLQTKDKSVKLKAQTEIEKTQTDYKIQQEKNQKDIIIKEAELQEKEKTDSEKVMAENARTAEEIIE